MKNDVYDEFFDLKTIKYLKLEEFQEIKSWVKYKNIVY